MKKSFNMEIKCEDLNVYFGWLDPHTYVDIE